MYVHQVNATHGAWPSSGPSAPPSPNLGGTLGGIAQGLQTSVATLRGQLKSGLSLADIAGQSGMSRSDLTSLVKQQIDQQRAARNLPMLDPTVVERMVNRAIDRKAA